MTRWWWVRHGPTHQSGFVGWTDVPADLGDVAALRRLDAYLPADAPLVSSDLSRTRATADAIAGARARLPHERDLREFNFGSWEGRRYTQIASDDPALARDFWENPGDSAPPGGESWNAVAARVAAVVGRLSAPGTSDIIAVAHFGAILSQVGRCRGFTPRSALGQPIDTLSVTRIDIGADGPVLAEVNHRP